MSERQGCDSWRRAFGAALQKGAAALGLELTPGLATAFERYYDLLLGRNRRGNLTRITRPEEAAAKHFLDSWLAAPLVPAGARRLVDVGSGAGFPGVVIGLVRPELAVTLLDAQRKRVEFLREVIGALGLRGAEAVQVRAEEAGRSPAHRERYDCAVARAVAPLPVLAELCLPLVRLGGAWIALKGPAGEEEAAAAAGAIVRLGGVATERVERRLPGGERRTLLVFRKVQATPANLPRRAGVPERSPLR